MTEIISPLSAAPADAVAYYRAHSPPKSERRVGRITWEPILLEMIEDRLTHAKAWEWAQAHYERLGFKLPSEITFRDWLSQLRAEHNKQLRRRKPKTFQLPETESAPVNAPTTDPVDAPVKAPEPAPSKPTTTQALAPAPAPEKAPGKIETKTKPQTTSSAKSPAKTDKLPAQIRNERVEELQRIADETRQMGTKGDLAKSGPNEPSVPEFVGPPPPSVNCTKEETANFKKLRKDALAAYIVQITAMGYEFLEPFDGFHPPSVRKMAETAP